MNEDALTLAEAVPLGYAVLAQVAEDVGVRMLAIKGPILAMQGLREPRQSADIDVLVEPAGFAALTRGLEDVGWRNHVIYDCPGFVPKHSANHRHPHWPCEVDVHHWFPGFLADPSASFEVFWSRRSEATLAGRALPTLDVVAHGALAALHYLRDEGRSLRSSDLEALAVVMETEWSAAAARRPGRAWLLPPEQASRCDPCWSGLACESSPHRCRWRCRSRTGGCGARPRLRVCCRGWSGLRQTAWRSRYRYLLRALWPDARQMTGVDPADPPRWPGIAGAAMGAAPTRSERAAGCVG